VGATPAEGAVQATDNPVEVSVAATAVAAAKELVDGPFRVYPLGFRPVYTVRAAFTAYGVPSTMWSTIEIMYRCRPGDIGPTGSTSP